MVSEIRGPNFEIGSTEGADDNNVINTLLFAHISCVEGSTMAASDVKVNSAS